MGSEANILILLKNSKEDPKFKVGDHVRISKYQTYLLQDILQIGLKKFL